MSIAKHVGFLMEMLGINQAHLAARMPSDWMDIVKQRPQDILSLALICPPSIDPQTLRLIADKMLVINGDVGPFANSVDAAVSETAVKHNLKLRSYYPVLWADIVADHTDQVGEAMLQTITNGLSQPKGINHASDLEDGELDGINYQIRGSGPPLLLFPLALSPSQWKPLISRLSEHFCTISLSGPKLGAMPALEARGKGAGYEAMVESMLNDVHVLTCKRQLGDEVSF